MEDIKRTQIGLYHNALNAETCKGMIEWFESKKEDHGVYRDNWKRKDISIPPLLFSSWLDNYSAIVDEAIDSAVDSYSKSLIIQDKDKNAAVFDSRNLDYGDFGYKFQKSSTGGGFCTWHAEHGYDENISKRVLVWMFYLNTTNSGFTEFDFQGVRVQPTEGTLVLWPAYFTHPHRAAPDLQEDKYIITGWLHHK